MWNSTTREWSIRTEMVMHHKWWMKTVTVPWTLNPILGLSGYMTTAYSEAQTGLYFMFRSHPRQRVRLLPCPDLIPWCNSRITVMPLSSAILKEWPNMNFSQNNTIECVKEVLKTWFCTDKSRSNYPHLLLTALWQKLCSFFTELFYKTGGIHIELTPKQQSSLSWVGAFSG